MNAFSQEHPCDVCYRDPAACICPECPTCKVNGEPRCYLPKYIPPRRGMHKVPPKHVAHLYGHGMMYTKGQMVARCDHDAFEATSLLQQAQQLRHYVQRHTDGEQFSPQTLEAVELSPVRIEPANG